MTKTWWTNRYPLVNSFSLQPQRSSMGTTVNVMTEERALVAMCVGLHPPEAVLLYSVLQSNLSAALCKLPEEMTSSLPTRPRIAPSAALCLLALNSCFCYIYTDQGQIKQEQPNFFPMDPISSSLGIMSCRKILRIMESCSKILREMFLMQSNLQIKERQAESASRSLSMPGKYSTFTITTLKNGRLSRSLLPFLQWFLFNPQC